MRLKVLHISISLAPGGAEKLLVDALPKYAAEGVDADLLLLDGTETPFMMALRKSFTGKLLISKYKSIYNPLHIIEIKRHLGNYDVVHVHLFPPMYWAALAKFFFRSKTPLIFTEHSTFNRRIGNPLFRTLDRWIYSFYAKITAITTQVKDQLVNVGGIDAKDCEVIYNGIDLDKYNSAQAYDTSTFFADTKAPILMQVSSFQEAKDQKTLIEALLLLSDEVKLILVGDGKLKSQYVSMVSELELGGRVLFLGVRTDIPELLKTATIVVQSSNWEGFGLAAVEGMAAGKPVVASNVPGLKQVVVNAGLIFEKGSPEDLAVKIKSLLTDKVLYDQTAERCKKRASTFGLKPMVDKFIHLYRNV